MGTDEETTLTRALSWSGGDGVDVTGMLEDLKLSSGPSMISTCSRGSSGGRGGRGSAKGHAMQSPTRARLVHARARYSDPCAREQPVLNYGSLPMRAMHLSALNLPTSQRGDAAAS